MYNPNQLISAAFLVLLLVVTACGSKKTSIPAAPAPADIPVNLSTDIVINYRLDKAGLRDTFNRAIDDALKGNFDIPDYDIKMTLSKARPATVEIEGKNLLVVVPVTVNLEKSTFLADLKAKGTMEMNFITDVDIDSVWNVKTATSLSYHRWIEKPKLSVGAINIPIQTISDIALSKTKYLIEQGINESVNSNMDVKQKMKENMKMFDQPMRFDTSISAWLNIKPEKFFINKVKNSKLYAEGKVSIKGTSTFSTYKPQAFAVSKNLPRVYWNESIPDSSVFRLAADIKTSDINPVLKANLDGKTFSTGDKSITLSNIITNCDYEFLRVITDVQGAANGTLVIKGKPVYDKVANGFRMENIDIQFKTKNVLHKAAAWIAEGKIRQELEEKLTFNINETIRDVQKSIDNQLADFNKKYDLDMKLGLGSVGVESFKLKPGQIEAVMVTRFYLEVGIRDLRSFNRF